MTMPDPSSTHIVLAGATGTIGGAVAKALAKRGFKVTCLVRDLKTARETLADVSLEAVDFSTPFSVDIAQADIFISCLASRTGVKSDAEAVDYQANMYCLEAAEKIGVRQFILLSAICVQKPILDFQFAKLKFEEALKRSANGYTIVRPTAFFKSLSGQVEKVKRGGKYLIFGDGELTRCKPISDRDLANFIVDQIGDPTALNRTLPIGGPGPAISPLDQARYLFALLGEKPRIKHVPVKLMDLIVSMLGAAAKVLPSLEEKAEYARIGRYYATESMLVYDAESGAYDADATPSYGEDTLFDYYEECVNRHD